MSPKYKRINDAHGLFHVTNVQSYNVEYIGAQATAEQCFVTDKESPFTGYGTTLEMNGRHFVLSGVCSPHKLEQIVFLSYNKRSNRVCYTVRHEENGYAAYVFTCDQATKLVKLGKELFGVRKSRCLF
jgi:hypothetical protein